MPNRVVALSPLELLTESILASQRRRAPILADPSNREVIRFGIDRDEVQKILVSFRIGVKPELDKTAVRLDHADAPLHKGTGSIHYCGLD